MSLNSKCYRVLKVSIVGALGNGSQADSPHENNDPKLNMHFSIDCVSANIKFVRKKPNISFRVIN